MKIYDTRNDFLKINIDVHFQNQLLIVKFDCNVYKKIFTFIIITINE